MCRRMPGAIRARAQTIAQRKGNAIAALVMHGTLLDRNDALRAERVMAHDSVFMSTKHERDLAAETGF